MATSFQGAPGPSGQAGLQRAPVQPVGGNYATPELVLTRSEQPSQERVISNQIRKLTVRLLADTFDLRVNHLPGDTRTLLKRSWNSIRYDHIPLTDHQPDQLVGVVCDEGNGCRFVGAFR